MSASPIDPLDGPRWAVAGRVVTMDARNSVLDPGVVYIDKGVIVDVRGRADAAPAGFEGVVVLQTRGTVYPGLIELHNHLCYNALPLWTVPRRFTDRDQWQSDPDYKEAVGKPMRLVASTSQMMAAMARYVEVKLLVAGVTASQGITLGKFKGDAQAFFRGTIRNVEQTGEAALPGAQAHIGDIAAGEVEATLAEQRQVRCYLQHLCEGTDPQARQHLLDLKLADGTWAIGASMTGIHSLALTRADFAVLKQAGAKVVWSPTSNFLLYGATADIAAARSLGLLVGLGCDWSPSGSKNLLWELKVARAHSAMNGSFMKDIELVAAVTRDAARILGWDKALGTLQAGMRADLMVIGRSTGDPYAALLESTERDVSLVAINGYVRYGHPDFVKQVQGAGEEVTVAGVGRELYLKQATADPNVAALSFAAARDILAHALQNFGQVALKIAQAAGKPPPAELLARSSRYDDEIWVLAEEELREMGIAAPAAPAASMPRFALAEHEITGAERYELDPITVADDPSWVSRVGGQPNLPAYVKKALYGS